MQENAKYNVELARRMLMVIRQNHAREIRMLREEIERLKANQCKCGG